MEHDGSQEKKNQRPLDILLVEDNEADVKIAARAFKTAKLQTNVYTVNDGQSCLDFIRHQGLYQDKTKYPRPDIILLDINLPKLDGFEVLKNLKNDKNFSFIPIVVLTGSKNQDDVTKSYIFGANSFIQKPVDYTQFVEVIEAFNHYWQKITKLPAVEK